MKSTLSRAALFTALTFAVPATPAFAASGSEADVDVQSAGCVSNAEYAKLSVGQSLAYVRGVAGDDAQSGVRFWGGGNYQERLYRMCTPISSAHGTLTTRFMNYYGTWRAFVVDTHIGPEN